MACGVDSDLLCAYDGEEICILIYNKNKAMNFNQAIQLSAQLLGGGRFADAKKICEQIIKQVPNHADAHHFLGLARHQLGESKEGIQSIQKAIQIDQNQPGFHMNLAHVLREVGRTDEAKNYYKNALKLNPANMQAILGLGQCAIAERQPKEALEFFENDKGGENIFHGVVLSQMVIAHIMLGEEYLAISKLEEAIATAPEDPMLISTLGSLYQSEERYTDAKKQYEKAYKIQPSVMSAGNLGAVCMIVGDMEASESCLKKAIELDKTHGSAYYHLSAVSDDAFKAYEAEAIKLAESTELKEYDRARMHFALYRFYKKQKATEKAIDHLLKGNALYKPLAPFEIKSEKAFFKMAADVILPERLDRLMASGNSSDAPIFIIGMPRSGTTLTEQILSSHSAVQGMGELKYVAQALGGRPYEPAHYGKLADEEFAEKSDWYLEQVQEKGWSGQGRFTDKMPSNFLYVSGIRAMFPNAKIVHVQRAPMSTCFSNFEQLFAEGQHWCYDQKTLGQYYGLYSQLMKYFESYENLDMFTLSYEGLVNDTENTVKALLEYCELPWEDTVLDFHQQTRDVQTASATQVRQPMYKGSLESWKAYETELSVLKETLISEGVA